MAGYIGNKAVGLNVTTGNILGDVGVGGNIDVDGISNLDVVDIDGAVNMATTLETSGVVTVKHTDGVANVSLSPTSTGGVINVRNSSGVGVITLDGRNGLATIGNKLILTDGNLVVAAGHGIDFAAQTATSAGGASVTSELLDHYEEGTWTPTIVAGTASVNNTATYTKIGRLVTCQLDITYPSQTNNNDADVEGLPFTSANNVAEPGAAVFSNLHASNNLVGFNAKNNTRFRLQDGGGTSTTLTAMAGKVLRATVTYITAT